MDDDSNSIFAGRASKFSNKPIIFMLVNCNSFIYKLLDGMEGTNIGEN